MDLIVQENLEFQLVGNDGTNNDVADFTISFNVAQVNSAPSYSLSLSCNDSSLNQNPLTADNNGGISSI